MNRQGQMARRYYYTLDDGAANFQTVSFGAGRAIGEYLRFRNGNFTDTSDLEQFEAGLLMTHISMGQLVNEFHEQCRSSGVIVPNDRYQGLPYDELLAVPGRAALVTERQLSMMFLTLVAMASGLEDRMARITMQLFDVSGGAVWPSTPRPSRRMSSTQRASNTRNALRRASNLDVCRLEEISTNRNRSIHERYDYPHVVDEDGALDVIFSPAMNPAELSSTVFPTYRATTLSADVNWLIERYLAWWCSESVIQIHSATKLARPPAYAAKSHSANAKIA